MKLLAAALILWSLGLSGQAEVVVTPEQFGAVGDGETSDWVPLQKALAFCASAVHSHALPNGKESEALQEKGHQSNAWCRIRFSKSYLSGPLIINSSRTTLEIAEGAKIVMFSKTRFFNCPRP